MQKFKVGDKVRCINAEDSYELKQGEIYTVERGYFGSDLCLVGVDFSWRKDRFELVEVGEEPTKELKQISVTLNAEQVQYLLQYAVERMIEEQMKRKKSQLNQEV